MKDGQKVVFQREGDQEPGMEPGVIIIILEERPHKVDHENRIHVAKLICKERGEESVSH